ncbi:MAG: hypothetical protein JNN12_10900 [Bacteroidetes Order II. Incertae sedis bacterium]|nr:hypothetical protein [Bacteroidetes Order II. bacterium]
MKEELPELTRMATKPFGLEVSENNWDAETLRNTLAIRISWLLTHRREELLSILYRIDVREYDVKRILTFAAIDEIPVLLADLILEKLREKLVYRKKYPPEKEMEW